MPRPTLLLIACVATLSLPAAPAAAKGIGSLFSCDAPGQANTTGAVLGGLVGALAGSQISKNERALGAAIGAGIGAAIGNNIGCRMDRSARQDAEQAFERALETGRDQSWSDPQTGTSGRVEVVGRSDSAPPRAASSGRWRFAEGVAPARKVSNIGGAFTSTGRVNVRAAPNLDAQVVDRLRAGEQFWAAGSAAGDWLAVEEDGRIQGYVSRSVVRPLDEGSSGDCRRVQQTITERGQPAQRETYEACRDSSGAWNLIAI